MGHDCQQKKFLMLWDPNKSDGKIMIIYGETGPIFSKCPGSWCKSFEYLRFKLISKKATSSQRKFRFQLTPLIYKFQEKLESNKHAYLM